jgi:hypothetical protein
MKKIVDWLYRFRWLVLVSLLIALGVAAFFSFGLRGQLNQIIAQKKEAERPAEINLISISDLNCRQCQQVAGSIQRAIGEQLNVRFISQEEFSFGTKEAGELIEKFQIKAVPALILSGELNKTRRLQQTLESLGEKRQESLIIAAVAAPYRDLKTDKIVGEFKLTYLTNKGCLQCYDVAIHKNILASLGLFPFEEQSLDVNSVAGIQLVNQYGIQKVPTILLEGDLKAYLRFSQIWPQIGRVTDNGKTYIFEALEQMGTYQDLEQGKIIQLSQQNPSAAVHGHVNFLVFLEGEPFDFAKDANRYFAKDQQVHMEGSTLEGAAGKVIHIHGAGVSLQDFLRTLGWRLSSTCLTTDEGKDFCNQGTKTLKVFRNGEPDPSFGAQELQDGDQYLITFGEEDETALEQQIRQVPNFAF